MSNPLLYLWIQRIDAVGNNSGVWEGPQIYGDASQWLGASATRQAAACAYLNQIALTGQANEFKGKGHWIAYLLPEQSWAYGCYGRNVTNSEPFVLSYTNSGKVQGVQLCHSLYLS